MLNFLIKDWYSNRPLVYLFLGVVVLNSALMLGDPIRPEELIALHCLIATLLPLSFVSREDKFRSTRLICSLPLTRKAVTRYRYLSAWAYASTLGLFAAALIGIALWMRSELPRLLTPGVLLVGLTCISLALAVFLPVVIRFGLWGLIIPLVILQVLGVVTMILVSVSSRRLNFSSLVVPVRAWLDTAYSELGPPLYYLGWLALLVILNLVSCRFSEWLFARREC
ncbi:MAG: ABC-2 transporter permease [Acidobacteria bacterium]|nr:MAG: ABC-2 transporter permease [Acidobacteriota bacterium]